MNRSENLDIIVKLASKHNTMAQHKLYDMFHREMLGLTVRMVGNVHDAEDLLQESFIAAFTNIGKLKDPSRFGGWLRQIVVNNSITHLKRRDYFSPLEEVRVDQFEDESDEWYKDLSFEEIRQEIDNLPNGCREIFTLYIIEEYKQREIAKMLGISLSTVKSQYRYSLSILRSKLNKQLLK